MTVQDILTKVASKEISPDDASKLIAALQPKGKAKSLYLKVSERGGISVYGLQRLPVTLYVQQWERLLAFAEDIRAFAKANDSKLSRKGDE